MTTRKPAAAKKPAAPRKAAAPKAAASATTTTGPEATTAAATEGAAAESATPETVKVKAVKAFLGVGGWVQPGDEIDVTPDRQKDLARNGLIEGSTATGGTPLGEVADRSTPLNVSAG